MKALFLDRDGVINRELGRHVRSLDEFEILPAALKLAKYASEKGYLIIVITNQSGIDLGLYSHGDVEAMHAKMLEVFETSGSPIKGIFYCPHHPTITKCLCRKPGSLMLEKAIACYNISPERSFLIGDRQRDVDAAHAAGVKGYLVESNAGLEKCESFL